MTKAYKKNFDFHQNGHNKHSSLAELNLEVSQHNTLDTTPNKIDRLHVAELDLEPNLNLNSQELVAGQLKNRRQTKDVGNSSSLFGDIAD